MVDVGPDSPNADATLAVSSTDEEAATDENVFQVLGRQARTRTPHELWLTTGGALLSAGLVWWQHPALLWLAAGFLATAAYGAWGLLDRAADDTPAADKARNLVAVIGTGAALWAVLGFMAAALGGWRH
jgi:hypothetical protein